MFDFERLFSGTKTARLVATQSARLSLEQRQRDIFDSHRHRTFALAFYMTGSEPEAELILSETFVRAFRAAELPDGRSIDAALLSELRERCELADPGTFPAPQAALSMGRGNVLRTEMEEAMRELPATERLIFLLHDVEGYQAEAIAELLELPVGTVRRATMTARIRLRSAIAAIQAEEAERRAAA